MTRRHPEQQKGEIYLGTATRADMRNSVWKKMRQGTPHYFGRSLLAEYPWFVRVEEVEERIAMIQASDRDLGRHRLSTYENWVAEQKQ